MKKRIFEERLEVYEQVFSYLRDIKNIPGMRVSPEAVERLSSIDVSVKMLGTDELIHIIQQLKLRLVKTSGEVCRARDAFTDMHNSRTEYLITDCGLTPESAEQHFAACFHDEEIDFEQAARELQMSDEEIDAFTNEAIKEMRRSLRQWEFPFCVQWRKRQIDKSLTN